eukprot:gene8617-10969_t
MVGPVTQFQYVNLTNVTIWGLEARGEYRFAPEWAVAGWTAFAQGTDTRTGLPVDSVSPWTTQARIRYGFDKGLVAQLIGTVAAAHSAVSSPTAFQAPAYFNLDATVGYVINDHFKVNAGAFNITNAKYWNSPDMVGIQASNPQLDLYAQPGRYFVPAALSAERLPAPPARGPRVPVALSLALHGLAIIPLLLAGISGSSANDDEPALMVELSLAAPTAGPAAEADQPESTPEPQQ